MGANILDGAPPAIRDLLTSMWADIERSSRELEERKAKADPTKHRDSRVIENASYRYYGTKNGCGSRVRFCYSTHRNVAGYFLIWREVVTKSEVKRDQWDSSKSKADAKLARRKRWEAARTRPHPAGWYLTKA